MPSKADDERGVVGVAVCLVTDLAFQRQVPSPSVDVRSWNGCEVPALAGPIPVPLQAFAGGGRWERERYRSAPRTVVDENRTDPVSNVFLTEEFELACIRNLLASPEERLFFKDRESRFLVVSEGFLKEVAAGRSLADVVGRTDFDIFSSPHAEAAFEDERQVMATGQAIVAKIECETFEDRPNAWVSTTKLPLRDEDGEIIGTWGISRDVTALIVAEEALVHQTLHDSVTGLPNRVALMDRLAQALVALERRPGRVGLMFIDLDDFKDVNDAFGHGIGDRVLAEVGRRLSEVARRVDTVARLGGDEFVLLLSHLHDSADVRLICERVASAVRSPLSLDSRDLQVTGSVGVVVTDDPLIDPDELMRRADVAMYGAKRAGRNRFEVYDADVHVQSASQRVASAHGSPPGRATAKTSRSSR